jgi:LacI family sucrose operon transcriptional repressor
VILPKIDSSSTGHVVSGVLSVLNEYGYHLMLADTQSNPEKELEYLSVFGEKRVDGIILIATVLTDAHKEILERLEIPIVIVGQKAEGYPSVYHDDFHAIYDMTRNILEKGRTNLGYIGVMEEDQAAGMERYQGYRKAVCEAGLEALAEHYIVSDFTIEGGYVKTKELLARYDDLDGILCATDEIAIGVIKYLKEQKIPIPEQIMVTGNGDTMLSDVVEPSLTTIHYRYEESGITAAQILLELISADEKPGKENTSDKNQRKEMTLERNNKVGKEIKMGYFIIEKQSSEKE